MKRFIAFLCTLILVCSIAAAVLAACTHSYILVHETVAGSSSVPYCWTTCEYNQYVHPYFLNYEDKVRQAVFCEGGSDMKKLPVFILAAALVLSVVSVCFAALSCTHKSCTYRELWQKKDAPVYCSFCQYNYGPHPHIREFWKVTGTDTCDYCKKS